MAFLTGQGGSFGRKLLFAILLVVLADVLLFNGPFGSMLGLFALAWAGFSLAAQKSGWRNAWALVAYFLAFIFACILAYDPSFLGWVLFCGSLTLAVLLPQIDGPGDGWYWLKRLAFHGFGTPFGPLLDLGRLAKARRRPGAGMSIGRMLPNLVLPLAGTAIFLLLFAMANPIIADFLDRIQIGNLTEDDIARIFFWGLFFVVAWSTLRPRRTKTMFRQLAESEPGRIAGVTVASVTLSLAMFNLLFAVQNGLDIAYLWGDAELPTQFTLAEYAHRGAYPLVVTALLAGLFVVVTTHPKSELAGNRTIRWLVILWIAQNLMLLASTVERTLLYIDSYSLTVLRIAALLWMALVGTGLILVTWRMLRGNSLAWLVNGNVLALLAVLGLCSVVDLGEIAARWNVRHAAEVGGKGVQLDLCYLSDSGSSALLPLARLERRRDLDSTFLRRVSLVRQDIQNRMEDRQKDYKDWRWRDAQRLAALYRLAPTKAAIPAGTGISCHGDLVPYVDSHRYEG